jgi:hypothetical protein
MEVLKDFICMVAGMPEGATVSTQDAILYITLLLLVFLLVGVALTAG